MLTAGEADFRKLEYEQYRFIDDWINVFGKILLFSILKSKSISISLSLAPVKNWFIDEPRTAVTNRDTSEDNFTKVAASYWQEAD